MPRPVASILAALLAACSGTAPMSRPPPDAALGVTWQLETWSGHDLTPLAGRPVTLHIEQGRLASSGPCNHVAGNATLEGGTLRLGPLRATKRYCASTMALEQDWLQALNGALAVELSAPDRLTLIAADGSRMEFRAAP